MNPGVASEPRTTGTADDAAYRSPAMNPATMPYHGLPDHDVEVPQPVAEDGDEVRDGTPKTSVKAVSAKNSSKIGASASRGNISAASRQTH